MVKTEGKEASRVLLFESKLSGFEEVMRLYLYFLSFSLILVVTFLPLVVSRGRKLPVV